MYAPAVHDESTGYAEYVDQQLEALRASAHGLTEEQARLTPTRSALSIGGVIKHTSYVIAPPEDKQGRIEEGGEVSADAFAAFMDTFALRDDETLAGTIEVFDRRRVAIVEWVASRHADADSSVPPAPWFGQMTSSDVKMRYSLVHVIEELARHAGHADIIREQIDGAQSGELVLADTGRPATPFAQPWSAKEPATS
ncbi:MAG: DinB family protein [Janibacter sp.]|nr:DinB family protein [Janibacter sp.]